MIGLHLAACLFTHVGFFSSGFKLVAYGDGGGHVDRKGLHGLPDGPAIAAAVPGYVQK